MATLEAVLAAPKKKRTVVPPHQKVLKQLARHGWNENGRGTKTVYVRQYGDEVFLTNTYMMRRWNVSDDVAKAVRSVLEECSDRPEFRVSGETVDGMMVNGWELSLTASQGGSFLVANGPDMMGVWPHLSGNEVEITSWEPSGNVPETVDGTDRSGRVRVRVNAKYLKAMADGVQSLNVYAVAGDDNVVRKPLLFIRYGYEYGILMPVRIS